MQSQIQFEFSLSGVSLVNVLPSNGDLVDLLDEPTAGVSEVVPADHHIAAVLVSVVVVEQLLRYGHFAREVNRSAGDRLGLFRRGRR